MSPPGFLLPISVLVLPSVLATAGMATVLPEIGRELSLPTAGSSWILSAYQLAFAAAAALSGRLAERWGAGVMARSSIALFAAGALLAGVAWSYPMLVLGRFVEGMGAGAILVLSQILLTGQRDEEVRRRMLGVFTAVMTAVSAAGPLMGGVVGETLGWRALTMLPALSILVGPVLGTSATASGPVSARSDLGATAVLAILLGVGGLMLATRVPTLHSGSAIAGGLAAGMVGAAGVLGYVTRRRSASPVLMGNRVFRTACVVGAAVFGAYFGLLFAVPILLSRGWGWSATEIGLSLLSASCLGVAGSWLGGRARLRSTPRAVIFVACVAGCSGVVTAAVMVRPLTLILAIGLASAALGTCYPLALNSISLDVPESSRGTALGVFNVCFYLAGAMISAIIGLLLQTAGGSLSLLTIAVLPLIGAVASMTLKAPR